MVGATVGVVLSLLAYKFVEKPLRRRGQGRRRRLVLAGVSFALCAMLATTLSTWRPFAQQNDLFDQVVYRGFAYDATSRGVPYGMSVRFADVYIPPVVSKPMRSWETGGIVRAYHGTVPEVVVIGSSHGMMYAGQIDDVCRELGLSVAFFLLDGKDAITPQGESFDTLAGKYQDFYEMRDQWVDEWRPKTVILIDRWDSKDLDTLPEAFHDFVGELERSAGATIVLSQVPVLRFGQHENLREYVIGYYRHYSALPRMMPNDREEKRKLTVDLLEREAACDPRLTLIRADEFFYCADGSVKYCEGRSFLYLDDDHLAEAGAALLHEPLAQAIAAACDVQTPQAP